MKKIIAYSISILLLSCTAYAESFNLGTVSNVELISSEPTTVTSTSASNQTLTLTTSCGGSSLRVVELDQIGSTLKIKNIGCTVSLNVPSNKILDLEINNENLNVTGSFTELNTDVANGDTFITDFSGNKLDVTAINGRADLNNTTTSLQLYVGNDDASVLSHKGTFNGTFINSTLVGRNILLPSKTTNKLKATNDNIDLKKIKSFSATKTKPGKVLVRAKTINGSKRIAKKYRKLKKKKKKQAPKAKLILTGINSDIKVL